MTSEREPVPRAGKRIARRKAVAVVIMLVVVLVVLIGPFIFLEARALNIYEQKYVPSVDGATSLDLSVTASRGELNVSFAPLDGKAMEVTADVEGHASVLSAATPLNFTMDYTDDVAQGGHSIKANVSFDAYAPWPYYSLNRTHFDVVIDPSLNTSLDLGITTGGIRVSTAPGVVLEGLRLNATSEGAVVTFNNGTTLAGDVQVHTATGGTQFRWYNVSVLDLPTVTLSESSGLINATFYQHQPLNGSVNVQVVDDIGDIKLAMDLSGAVNSAMIRSNKEYVPLGGSNFMGSYSAFHSSNYPSDHVIDVRLSQNGGILGGGDLSVDGRWTA